MDVLRNDFEHSTGGEGAKLIETRQRRVQRAHTELAEGKRRPCCWPGCMHREHNGKN